LAQRSAPTLPLRRCVRAPAREAARKITHAPAPGADALRRHRQGCGRSPVVGPTLGGWLADNFSWRWGSVRPWVLSANNSPSSNSSKPVPLRRRVRAPAREAARKITHAPAPGADALRRHRQGCGRSATLSAPWARLCSAGASLPQTVSSRLATATTSPRQPWGCSVGSPRNAPDNTDMPSHR
jgi:hypothetical protein